MSTSSAGNVIVFDCLEMSANVSVVCPSLASWDWNNGCVGGGTQRPLATDRDLHYSQMCTTLPSRSWFHIPRILNGRAMSTWGPRVSTNSDYSLRLSHSKFRWWGIAFICHEWQVWCYCILPCRIGPATCFIIPNYQIHTMFPYCSPLCHASLS